MPQGKISQVSCSRDTCRLPPAFARPVARLVPRPKHQFAASTLAITKPSTGAEQARQPKKDSGRSIQPERLAGTVGIAPVLRVQRRTCGQRAPRAYPICQMTLPNVISLVAQQLSEGA